MMLTPFLAIGARAIAGRIAADRASRPHAAGRRRPSMTDHVIIGGYGRVGQLIGRLLQAENVPFVALDTNGELASEGSKRGETVFFGDAARREFLHRAGAAGARAFVVTVNSPRAAERMVAAAHKERPDAPVFARARDPAHASRLLKLGAVEVTPEAVEASLQLGARVLEGLGVSDDAIARRVDDMRARSSAYFGDAQPAAATDRNAGRQPLPRQVGTRRNEAAIGLAIDVVRIVRRTPASLFVLLLPPRHRLLHPRLRLLPRRRLLRPRLRRPRRPRLPRRLLRPRPHHRRRRRRQVEALVFVLFVGQRRTPGREIGDRCGGGTRRQFVGARERNGQRACHDEIVEMDVDAGQGADDGSGLGQSLACLLGKVRRSVDSRSARNPRPGR